MEACSETFRVRHTEDRGLVQSGQRRMDYRMKKSGAYQQWLDIETIRVATSENTPAGQEWGRWAGSCSAQLAPLGELISLDRSAETAHGAIWLMPLASLVLFLAVRPDLIVNAAAIHRG